MSGIVERLRRYRATDKCDACSLGVRHTICDEAADEIERLEVQISHYAYERDLARRERDEAITEKSK